MSQPLLSSNLKQEYVVDNSYSDPENIQKSILSLSQQVQALEGKLEMVKRDAVIVVLNLLAKSMKHVESGEFDIDEAITAPHPASSTNPVTTSKWDAIKKRLAPRLAEAIDILSLHGSMNNSQLAAALGMDRKSCTANIIPKLKAMGLIVKNGNNFMLKEL